MPARSVRCGGVWSAAATPPAPASVSPGCGTAKPSSSSRDWPFSELAALVPAIAGDLSADQRMGVFRGGLAQAAVQGGEQVARLLTRPTGGQERQRDARVEV